jgi:complement component 1 Q subcomponent-binding protein
LRAAPSRYHLPLHHDPARANPFQIDDKPGHQEVVLTRTFGDENIRITFTTADLNSNVPDSQEMDSAMYDNDVDDLIGEGQSGGANTKGSINQGSKSDGNIRVAPEDSIAPADREELDDEDYEDGQQQGFPARVNIRIERAGKGALAIEASAQDGDFLIEELWHFSSAELADPQTAEQEYKRRSLYTGPPFSNLDEDLQILLEKYLEERGINTRLALFIPDFIDHKEQKEYVRWLNSTYPSHHIDLAYTNRSQTSKTSSSKRRSDVVMSLNVLACKISNLAFLN